MNNQRILVFGDSIAYGAWDTQGGWVERLKQAAHQHTVATDGKRKIQVLNLGIGGDSSTKILQRMETEITARYSSAWPLTLIFGFGTNDERATDGAVETPLDQFSTNIRQIIATSRQFTADIVFLGSPPLAQSVIEFKGQEYADQRVREYDEHLHALIDEARLPFVELRSVFASGEQLHAYDGIHPNDHGHELIAQRVAAALGISTMS